MRELISSIDSSFFVVTGKQNGGACKPCASPRRRLHLDPYLGGRLSRRPASSTAPWAWTFLPPPRSKSLSHATEAGRHPRGPREGTRARGRFDCRASVWLGAQKERAAQQNCHAARDEKTTNNRSVHYARSSRNGVSHRVSTAPRPSKNHRHPASSPRRVYLFLPDLF